MSISIRSVPGIALVLAAAAALGCHGVPVTYEAPAAGTFDPTSGRPVEVRACGVQLGVIPVQILGVIPIRTNSRQKRAYDALHRRAPNSVLVDIKQQESWYYIFAGNLVCTSLSAMAHPVSK